MENVMFIFIATSFYVAGLMTAIFIANLIMFIEKVKKMKEENKKIANLVAEGTEKIRRD